MENELEGRRQQIESEKKTEKEMQTKAYTLRREITNPKNHNKK